RPCFTNIVVQFNMLINLGKDQNMKLFSELAEIPIGPENRDMLIWDMFSSVMFSSVLIFQFQIENFFQNILMYFNKKVDTSFVRLSNDLFNYLKLMDIDQKMM